MKSRAAAWVALASATSSWYVTTVPGRETLIARRAVRARMVSGDA